MVNVLTPVLVRKRFAANRVGLMMGVYAMLLGGGGALMAGLVVPIYHATGSWPVALGVAVFPAVIAILVLITQLRVPFDTTAPAAALRWDALLRDRTAWSITGFFGIQSLLFYTVLAWLSSIYVSKGATDTTAGLDLALCLLGVALGGLVWPSLAGRVADQRPHLVSTIVVCGLGLLGVLLLPASAGPFASVLLGFGLGGGQGLPGILYVRRAADQHQATQLSSMAQAIGYLVAALGPVAAQALHAGAGGWTWPLLGLLLLLVVNLLISLPAGH